MTRAFAEDVVTYAQVSGDHTAHMVRSTLRAPCSDPIVHGMLVGSLFSALLGTELPGVGSIYTGQTLQVHQAGTL